MKEAGERERITPEAVRATIEAYLKEHHPARPYTPELGELAVGVLRHKLLKPTYTAVEIAFALDRRGHEGARSVRNVLGLLKQTGFLPVARKK